MVTGFIFPGRFVSLHTQCVTSAWETIWDAPPHPSYQNFWFKIPWVPPLKYLNDVVWSTCPHPPKMKIWSGLGTWDLSWSGVLPLPLPLQKWKFGQIEGLWIWVGLDPLQMEIWTDWGTLDLSWSRVPCSWKWKLGHVEGLWIWVGPEYRPPTPWQLGQIVGLWISVCPEYLPSPSNDMWELVCGV